MSRKLASSVVEREGVNYVRAVVEGSGSLFQELDHRNDFGIDGQIEFVTEGNPTGNVVAVQIKAGKSYLDSNGRCSIPISSTHADYWRRHSLPVVGVVYDPDDHQAYWTDLSAWSRRQASSASFDKTPISTLSRDTFGRFFACIWQRQRVLVPDFEECVELARSPNPACHRYGVRGLIWSHLDSTDAWEELIDIFRYRDPADLDRGFLLYALALVPWHMDMSGPMLAEETRRFAEALIRAFSREDICRLLGMVDSLDFGRGTIGQHVLAILGLVSECESHLLSLVHDESLPTDIRLGGLVVIVGERQCAAAPVLKRFLATGGELERVSRLLLEHLDAHGHFNLVG